MSEGSSVRAFDRKEHARRSMLSGVPAEETDWSAALSDDELEEKLSTLFADAWPDSDAAWHEALQLERMKRAYREVREEETRKAEGTGTKTDDHATDSEALRAVVTAEVAKPVPVSSVVIPEGESGYTCKNMEARDRFIYERKKEGLLNHVIIEDLRKKSKKNWELLTTDKSITNAVKRYIMLTNAPALRPSQGGRPKGRTAK
jgi:hypothetical protein